MNDELLELASAYLDGAATADERARIEADPEFMALVDDLRRISAAVTDVPAAEPADRERAIAAALAAGPSGDEVVDPVVVPLRRPRTARMLSYAAALLAVGVLGAVVVSGVRDSGSDDAPTSAELLTDDAGDGPADTDDTADIFSADEAPESRQAEQESSGAVEADEPADADTMLAPPDAADADADEPIDGTAEDTAETSAVIDLAALDDADLGALIADLAALGVADTSPERPCGEVIDTVLEAADLVTTYAGDPALVGISEDRGRVVDPADCSVVAEVPLERSDG